MDLLLLYQQTAQKKNPVVFFVSLFVVVIDK